MGNVRLLKVIKKENPFVQLDKKTVCFNSKITFKAKGILSVLLGLKEGQEFNLTDLHLFSADGQSSTESGVKELKQKGFLEVCRWRETNGLFGWGFNVHETPLVNPVFKFTIIDNPNSNNKAVKLSNVAQLAQKYNMSDSDIALLNDLQANTPPSVSEVKTPPITNNTESLTSLESFKNTLSNDNEFKLYACKTYSLTDSDFTDLQIKFFEQKTILSGSKNYESYEALKNHVFNWINVTLKKNKVKPTPSVSKQENKDLPAQYNKEKVVQEISAYKAMVDNVTAKDEYKNFRENVKNLLYWLSIANLNKWLTGQQIERYTTLKKAFETAGELLKVFNNLKNKIHNDD